MSQFNRVKLLLSQTQEERTTWVMALPCRDFYLEDGTKYNATPKVLSRIARNTRKFIANMRKYAKLQGRSPYTSPVLVDHKWSNQRLGDIVGCKVARLKKLGLYMKVKWTPTAWRAIQNDEIKHVSIQVYSGYKDSYGVEYGLIARELSTTDRPVVEDLGTIQDTLRLRLSRLRGAREMDKEVLDELMGMIEDLMARVEALESGDPEEVEGANNDPEEPEGEMSRAGARAPPEELDSKILEELNTLKQEIKSLKASRGQDKPEGPENTQTAILAQLQELRADFAASRRPVQNADDPPGEPPREGKISESKALELGRRKGLKGTALVKFAAERSAE